MAASLAAALRNGFVSTGGGEGRSPSSPDGEVNGFAKVWGGASKGFELLTPPALNRTALLEEVSAPAEARFKESGEFRDPLWESAGVGWGAISRLEGRGWNGSLRGADSSDPCAAVGLAVW